MDILKSYTTEILIGLAVIVLLQFFFIITLSSRIGYVRKTLRSLLTGPNGEDLEAMLKRCLEESKHSLVRSEELESRIVSVATDMKKCVQHVGLIRYDAYGDVSGKQSFSLAILDGHHNGAIVTGLFGRQDGRCYGKAVVSGQTEQSLTEEEDAALHMALSGGVSLPPPSLNGKRRVARMMFDRDNE